MKRFTGLLFLIVMGVSCAKPANKAVIDPNALTAPATMTAMDATEEEIRLCLGSKQVMTGVTVESLEGFFGPTTLVDTLEGPVTYCLLMRPNSENKNDWQAYLRVEYEDTFGTRVLPYRALDDAFYADVWWEGKTRYIDVIFADGQGVVELYATGTDLKTMKGRIKYADFPTFDEALEQAQADAKKNKNNATVAQTLYGTYFGSTSIPSYSNSLKYYYDVYTKMIDTSGKLLGNITLDLTKSVQY